MSEPEFVTIKDLEDCLSMSIEEVGTEDGDVSDYVRCAIFRSAIAIVQRLDRLIELQERANGSTGAGCMLRPDK